MERELWAELSAAISDVDARWDEPMRCVHSTARIVRVYLHAVLHDRPVTWACQRSNWPRERCPRSLPDQATMSRRWRQPAFEQFLMLVGRRLNGNPAASLVKRIDGKPLTVAAHSTDGHAKFGRGAGMKARGYKLHALWSAHPMPDQWAVTPLNMPEKDVARRMLGRLTGGGYVLADAQYDANDIHDRAAHAGHQLIAPRPRPGSGMGHRRQSPHRARAIELLEKESMPHVPTFGATMYAQRRQIERDMGNLTSFGGGLTCLPPWVRRSWRVRHWVHGKLLINAARIRRRKTRRQEVRA